MRENESGESRIISTTSTIGELSETDARVKTFYRFHREPIPGGIAMVVEEFSPCTATQVIGDWLLLKTEAAKVVVVQKNQDLNLDAVKKIAPNLAHWAKDDDDLQVLLDLCNNSGRRDEYDRTNLDKLGRRKRVALHEYIDDLMADRLGLALETIRSYRQRSMRFSRA